MLAFQCSQINQGQAVSGRSFGADLRSFPIAGYLIFYRHGPATLTVVRILHAARDITPDLLSE